MELVITLFVVGEELHVLSLLGDPCLFIASHAL